MKKVLNAILNFFKMILIYIINFFLSLFPDRKKKDIKKNIPKENPNLKKETKQTYFEEATTNRDENISSELIKPIKEALETNIYTEKQLLLIKLIDDTIDKIIEKQENIKIKDLDLETEKKLKELKEKITPPIIKDISKDYIKTEYQLKNELTKALQIEFLEHPLFPPKETKETTILSNTNTNQTEEIIPNHIELKDEITNLITSSALIIANVTKELLSSPEKKNEKEVTINLEQATVPNPEQSIVTIQPDKEEPSIATPIIEEKEPTIPTLQEPKVKQENITIEETIKPIVTEEYKNEEENKNEQEIKIEQEKSDQTKKEDIYEKEIINLSPIQKSTDQIIDFTNEDCNKKELEEKNYETLEEEIDKMLNQITMFLLKYENKLTPEQKQQLEKELDRLRNTKEKMLTQKEHDIKEEENNLNQYITNEEIKGLKKELDKLDIEHQQELIDEKLNKVEELEYLEKKEADKIEKRILKKKLKKSSRLLALTSLLSLPFVRNKYFFYFTIGALVNYNFRLIDSLIHHQSLNKKPELPEIKKGQDALYEAINSTNENIIYLNNLEQEILMKHPDLSQDSEYLVYIRSLKDRLSKTEEKLKVKQEVLDKYCHKNVRYKKILRKTK